MIGRGTRLCPDLFGVGKHKTEFVIFDYCQNFEFFDAQPDGAKTKAIKSLTQQIFEAKLEVALLVREDAESTDEERGLAEAYIAELHQTIATLDRARFVVKAKLRYVVEYSEPARWQNISKGDMLDINTHLSGLGVPAKEDDELAKRFDILILNYQLALLTAAYSTDRFIAQISGTAKALLKKQNIPAVAKQVPMLNELQVEQFWKTINIHRLESVRVALRDLIKYLDKDTQPIVETNFEDALDFKGIEQRDLIPAYGRLQSYKDRVESYVREHSHHLVIQKLKTNKPITETEINALETILFDGSTVGTKQDYVATYGDKPLGVFIRNIVGLDVAAAQDAFAEFIQAGNLKADQMTFINNIIHYLTKNGMIEKTMLFEPPFTNIHQDGLIGVFDDASAKKVIQLVSVVNENALVKVGNSRKSALAYGKNRPSRSFKNR
jgi:type I restriction enzyme R subunit